MNTLDIDNKQKTDLLVIDDDPVILTKYKYIFKDFDAVYCLSDSEAISKLENNEYKVILTDLNLQVFSGIELFKKFHSVQLKSKWFLVTGYENILKDLYSDNMDIKEYVIDLGFLSYLSKTDKDFNDFYADRMEKLIEAIKNKLD